MTPASTPIPHPPWHWRARPVTYRAGSWAHIEPLLPRFRLDALRAAPHAPANPYLRTVIREPDAAFDAPVPVGVVSNTYGLAQHQDVVRRCLQGIADCGVPTEELTCELGLTDLGEWMNCRLYFPPRYHHQPADGEPIGLRLEVFNSVDGSSRLVLLLGWLRFVCSNGLVIGETKQEFHDIHNHNLDLDKIPAAIRAGMALVEQDRARLDDWQRHGFKPDRLVPWVDGPLAKTWGKKAACRVFHLCTSGQDGELVDPFAKGPASEKPWAPTLSVPGTATPAKTLYDVSQALSWIAERRTNPEERRDWQTRIPTLLQAL
ncbi:DUF945 domain-containing protein [Thiohalocapsa marina]|uniref:DUF945 domain-containing protein n=1 Tax=Thiohalocapsa marina TaxID=424902 RepID=A0A5M8FDI8_9GAMM|nr:DUF932 domain-containing protein [Thiohalocapsa marina]KAA6182737.1 DUF945 domain-containing protein [Thiohalocapsa marina]